MSAPWSDVIVVLVPRMTGGLVPTSPPLTVVTALAGTRKVAVLSAATPTATVALRTF
jgi:hypothetical protein